MRNQHVDKTVKFQCDFHVKASRRWVHTGAPLLHADGPCGEMFDVRANLIRHLGSHHEVEKDDAGRFIRPYIPGYTPEMRDRYEKMEKIGQREGDVRNRKRPPPAKKVGEQQQSESDGEESE